MDVAAITVRFSGVQVLNEVSFAADAGTIHALIGPNGAGKSTLFNVLSGIYRPAAGHAHLDGQDLVGLAPHQVARAGVGRAFQNSSMFASLTVEENLLLGRHRLTRSGVLRSGLGLPFARTEERVARTHVREVAEFLEVDHLLSSAAGDLPYGDAKRVDMARAVCTQPRLLLLDEPAAGISTFEKAAIGSAITRIARELGTTVLLVEHDMGLVMDISDKITVLNFGNVLVTEVPDKIRNDPSVIEAYLGHSAARDDIMQTRAEDHD